MAEMGDVFPRRDLGAAEGWGRHAEDRIKVLEKAITGTDSSLRSVIAGANSALSNVAQQAPRIERIEQGQADTVINLEAKGRVFAQPTMPSPPDPRAMWIDTDDKNKPYRGVELSVESDFSDGVNPFPDGPLAQWDVVDGAGREGGPALVLTGTLGSVWDSSEVWDVANHVEFDAWILFPTIAEKVQGGVLFTGTGAFAAVLDTLSRGTGDEATIQIRGTGFVPITGTSPFTIEANVWYNLRVKIVSNEVIAAVYDGDGGFLAETVSSVDGGLPVQTGSPGVFGTAATAGSGPQIGDFSATSAIWEAIPEEQALEDAAQALEDAQEALNLASEANQTVDGKNSIYTGTSEPTGTDFANGDLFFEQDSGGDVRAIKIWNGTSWADYTIVANQILVPGSVGAISIGDGAVTAPKIQADAVISDKIAADAIVSDKIAGGAIFGEHIAAGTITANKLTIGNFTNLIEDPNLDHPDTAWSLNSNAGVTSTTRGRGIIISGDGTYTPSYGASYFTVAPGDKFLFRAHLYNAASSSLRLQIYWRDEDGGDLGSSQRNYGSNNWTDNYEWEIPDPPPDARNARFSFRLNGASTGSARIVAPQILRRATGSLIVNGAITADKLSADAINGKTITGVTINGGEFNTVPNTTFGGQVSIYNLNGRGTVRLDAELGSPAPGKVVYLRGGGSAGSGANASLQFLGPGSGADGGEGRMDWTEVWFKDQNADLRQGIGHPGIFYETRGGGGGWNRSSASVSDVVQKTNSGPWAMSGGVRAWSSSISEGNTRTFNISFPAGRFSVTPLITLQASREDWFQVWASGETSSGFTLNVHALATHSGRVYWVATQMQENQRGG